MKKAFFILAIILGFGLMYSCEKDDKVILDLDKSVAPEITSPQTGGSYVLASLDEPILFQWTEAQYNIENVQQVKYRIQANKAGLNWEYTDSIVDIAVSEELEADVEITAINQALSRMEVAPKEAEDIAFRVLAYLTLDGEGSWLPSEQIELTVTGFELFTEITVAGSYQGWDHSNENTVLYSPDKNNVFEGYFFFEDANTEILFSVNDGETIWGDTEGDGSLIEDGDVIIVPETGVFRVIVDLNEETYTLYKTEWALIGDAADGWDTDVPMDLDVDHWQTTWKVKYTLTRAFNEGFFKFRANGAWDPPDGLNMGIDEDADEDGVLMYFGYGNDIPIDVDGNYTVVFDLSGPVYRYEVLQE